MPVAQICLIGQRSPYQAKEVESRRRHPAYILNALDRALSGFQSVSGLTQRGGWTGEVLGAAVQSCLLRFDLTFPPQPLDHAHYRN